jgi:hypothetical protein
VTQLLHDDDEVLEDALHRHELPHLDELTEDRPREFRRSRHGGEGGSHKLRFLERHVRFLQGEPRDLARRGSWVARRVPIAEDGLRLVEPTFSVPRQACTRSQELYPVWRLKAWTLGRSTPC